MLNPITKVRKWCFKGVLVIALLTAGTTPGVALEISQTFGTAISGYDTVAYHTEGRAMKGKAEFSYVWNDANWHFTGAKNRVYLLRTRNAMPLNSAASVPALWHSDWSFRQIPPNSRLSMVNYILIDTTDMLVVVYLKLTVS
jgi:hypothetical protein